MSEPTESREMFRHVEWPFSDGRFPESLGAFVQKTVLSGELPSLLVVHTDDNSWMVGDGVNDPNGPEASLVTHIWHAIARNSSITELVDLPLGHHASRAAPGTPWIREPHIWEE